MRGRHKFASPEKLRLPEESPGQITLCGDSADVRQWDITPVLRQSAEEKINTNKDAAVKGPTVLLVPARRLNADCNSRISPERQQEAQKWPDGSKPALCKIYKSICGPGKGWSQRAECSILLHREKGGRVLRFQ